MSKAYRCLVLQSKNKRVNISLKLNLDYAANETNGVCFSGHIGMAVRLDAAKVIRNGLSFFLGVVLLTLHKKIGNIE